MNIVSNLEKLKTQLEGELLTDNLSQKIYATDASVYQEYPDAVAIPKNSRDIEKIIRFCSDHKIPVIPRAAGTSLAGQCVGKGIVIDTSRNFNQILDLDAEARTIWVEPGVIRDELNHFLKPHSLHFGPNTSTANRCMIGGMVGNNSCGSTSIKYGSTRDHVLEMKVILSDGSTAHFSNIDLENIRRKANEATLEGQIYSHIADIYDTPEINELITKNFPHPEVSRRNTGYALDALLSNLNVCSLLAGSEGTLAFTTAVKLSLDPLPGAERVMFCPHFNSVHDAMTAIPLIMSFEPDICELMDKVILDCTKANKQQQKNRFFIQGDPQAVLMVQFNRTSAEALQEIIGQFSETITNETHAYANPKVFAPDDLKVTELRAAGLGVLANLPGEPKAVACIEDTAVRIEDLADYIAEFEVLMKEFGQQAVFYAHAGAGEIHLRPILDLKKQKDVDLFYEITKATALLVKKYNGSLSGEHGDGRVRAEFIPLMVGEQVYEIFKQIKQTWDPNNIFNPGKIVGAAPMTSSLRYVPEEVIEEPSTIFRFNETDGMIRAAEKCNGSGDCRKLSFSGGTMCPSFRATRDEKHTTRARANALRNFLSHPEDASKPFESEEIKEVLDLCLSCKACGTECPSNVDMTVLKSEFLYQYQKTKGFSFRSRLFANINAANKLASAFQPLSGWAMNLSLLKKGLGIAPERNLPSASRMSLKKFINNKFKASTGKKLKPVYLFIDEFTNFNDPKVGIKAVKLLDVLGYEIRTVDHPESGRAAFSKGFLDLAKKCANENVHIFSELISKDVPLIGIEPSAILGFRDEYPKIVSEELITKAEALKDHVLTIEEFLFQEVESGNINSGQFDKHQREILVHGHCHQKALSSIDFTAHILSLPANHKVSIIPSGCCGMAGSFGYEKEHFEISMKIGNDVLFPAIKEASPSAIVAAAGTSCRHQIKDGIARDSQHPVEILFDALVGE
ncbi:FAD-binding and (Fe-S)-binding domain-containing protein [Portibacter lacus]|uniref:Oxidoreductase n=1 Tax=Portibacter lacus TaxID=1099794 RepID=A0AA37SQB3_9BACT|nr:FAD-binding and (Fe-S)-binding domain-containing protein [Portibacter lacus]GLR16896.1 oxidoreductase [Portibacter lacus]